MTTSVPDLVNLEHLGSPIQSEPGLVSASAVTLVAASIGLAIALARAKLLAVVLGPSGVAVLANLATYSFLAVVIGSALTGQGAIRSVAEARAAGRSSDVLWLIRYTLTIPVAIGLAVFAITALTSAQVSTLVTGTSEYAPLVVLSALFIPASIFAAAYAQVLQAFLRVARIAASSVVGSVALMAATVLMAIPFGLTGAVLAVGVAAVAKVAYFALSERWVLHGWGRAARVRASRPPISPILGISLGAAVLGIAAAGVGLLVRASIVGILGLEQNGIYQPVADISETYLEVLLTSTGLYLFPKMTAQLTQGMRKEAARELGHGMRLLLVLVVPIALVTIGFGENVIRILYTGSFANATGPLQIQMAGNIVKVVAWSLGAGLLPLGMYRSWVLIGLVTLLVRYVSLLLLAPAFGLNGVAISYVLAWSWSAVATAIAVGHAGRLWPARTDWQVAASGGALVVLALAAALTSDGLGVPVSILATIGWLVVTRRDITELATEVSRVGGLWPRRASR